MCTRKASNETDAKGLGCSSNGREGEMKIFLTLLLYINGIPTDSLRYNTRIAHIRVYTQREKILLSSFSIFFTKEILCFCDNIILSAGYGAKSARVINAYCTEGLKVDSVIMRK